MIFAWDRGLAGIPGSATFAVASEAAEHALAIYTRKWAFPGHRKVHTSKHNVVIGDKYLREQSSPPSTAILLCDYRIEERQQMIAVGKDNI